MAIRLYTLRDVSRALGLPESTVRYYRDAFEDLLPVVGQGRRRRYPEDAVPLFRLIAEHFAANRSRHEIAGALADATGVILDGDAPADPAPVTASVMPVRSGGEPYEPLLATVLDGERERREVMWQLAREIVRLGEAVERQQVVLNEIARRVNGTGPHALPPAPESGPSSTAGPGPTHAADITDELEDQLRALRRELEQERELVDRLRKSKLDIERRAALAEEALADSDADEPPARSSMFRRVLRRDDDRPA